ncbi:hypothetical protein LTR95_016410 [Oleoguttula sp. CCFEE 5521]
MKHTTSKIKHRGDTIMRVAHKLVVKSASAFLIINLLALCLASIVVVLMALQNFEPAQDNASIGKTLPSVSTGIFDISASDPVHAPVTHCPDMPFPFIEYNEDFDCLGLHTGKSPCGPAPVHDKAGEAITLDQPAQKNSSMIRTRETDSTDMLEDYASDLAHTMVMRCSDKLSVGITFNDDIDILELHIRDFGALAGSSSAA